MASFVIPPNYAYVALAASGTFWLNMFQIITVSKARKEVSHPTQSSIPRAISYIHSSRLWQSGLKYPVYMAENSVAEKDPKAYRFNCCQRGQSAASDMLPVGLIKLCSLQPTPTPWRPFLLSSLVCSIVVCPLPLTPIIPAESPTRSVLPASRCCPRSLLARRTIPLHFGLLYRSSREAKHFGRHHPQHRCVAISLISNTLS